MCVGGVVRGCCCSKRALPSRFCCFPIQVKCIMKPFIWSTPGINFVHTVCSGLYPYILPTANCRTGHHACSGSGCGKFLNCKPSLKTVSSAEASCGHPFAHFFLYEHRRRTFHVGSRGHKIFPHSLHLPGMLENKVLCLGRPPSSSSSINTVGQPLPTLIVSVQLGKLTELCVLRD